MSRHRIVRKMNYDDERYDDDDDFGQSYEDRYCISPSTAAQFTYDRDRDHNLSSYMGDDIPEETAMETESQDMQTEESSHAKLHLTDIEKAQLQSCKEEVINIMGDNAQDATVEEVILKHKFNVESVINELLSSEAPKGQRTPRKRRDRTQGEDTDIERLLSEIDELDKRQKLQFISGGVRWKFRSLAFPPSSIAPKRRVASKTDQSDSSRQGPERQSVFLLQQNKDLKPPNSFSADFMLVQSEGKHSNVNVCMARNHSEANNPIKSSSGTLLSNTTAVSHSLPDEQKLPSAGLLAPSSSPTKKSDQGPQRKIRGGMSLLELVASHSTSKLVDESKSSSPPQDYKSSLSKLSQIISKRSVTSESQAASAISACPPLQNMSRSGLSLTDLVNLRGGQKKDVSALDKAGIPSQLSSSVSQSQLKESNFGGNFTATASPLPSVGSLRSDPFPSPATSQSPKTGPASVLGINRTVKPDGNELTLSDLIRRHQSATEKLACDSQLTGVQQSVANTIDQASANTRLLAKSESGLSANKAMCDIGEHAGNKENKDGSWSLVNCLRKNLAISPSTKLEKGLPVIESQTPQVEEIETLPLSSLTLKDQECDIPVTAAEHALRMKPSTFAQCISLRFGSERLQADALATLSKPRKTRYPKFLYRYQTRNLVRRPDLPLHTIESFDFMTPSPDDVVKEKQKLAFTPTGQENK